MKKNLLVALLAVATIGLTACNNEVKITEKQAKDYKAGESLVLSDGIINTAKAAIEDILKDPESVRWSTKNPPKFTKARGALIVDNPEGGIATYCVAFNAKNSFGGYVGDGYRLIAHNLTKNEATVMSKSMSDIFCDE
jgi:hypothetical protein